MDNNTIKIIKRLNKMNEINKIDDIIVNYYINYLETIIYKNNNLINKNEKNFYININEDLWLDKIPENITRIIFYYRYNKKLRGELPYGVKLNPFKSTYIDILYNHYLKKKLIYPKFKKELLNEILYRSSIFYKINIRIKKISIIIYNFFFRNI